MKILSEWRLVFIKQQGRERYCEARLKKLIEVSEWVEQYRQVWEARFDTLDEYTLGKQKLKNIHKKK